MNKITQRVKDKGEKGAYSLEIYNKQNKGYIEVWLTNEEQQMYDRAELTARLLSNANKKCKVVFFLSGGGDLFGCAEGLILRNL